MTRPNPPALKLQFLYPPQPVPRVTRSLRDDPRITNTYGSLKEFLMVLTFPSSILRD